MPREPRSRGRRCCAALLAAGLLLAAPAARAASFIPLAQDRTVVAEGQVSVPSGFDSDAAVAGAPDFGVFLATVEVLAEVGAAGATASAMQSSEIGPSQLVTWNGALAATDIAGLPGFVDAFAESFFSVIFAVDAVSGFALEAWVSIDEELPGDAFGSFQLIDLATGDELAAGGSGAPGAIQLGAEGTLLPDVPYALIVSARADAFHTAEVEAEIDVALMLVPEPGGGILATLLAGIAVAASRASRARRRG